MEAGRGLIMSSGSGSTTRAQGVTIEGDGMGTSRRFADVACTVCGCVCDDLRISVGSGRVTRAEGACFLAEPWFLAHDAGLVHRAQIEGEPVPHEEAVARAAQILGPARAPLVYGLSRSSTDGQRAAVALAERLGGAIDTTASLCHAPSLVALQQVGESTCTLGEVKNRADLVIFWRSDPLTTHPRHWERYSVLPVGEWTPRGRADRTVVVVDGWRTASAELADFFVPVEPAGDFEALCTLRGLVRGLRVAAGAKTGAPPALLARLAETMQTCRYGVVFFGVGLSTAWLGHRNVEALLQLVTDLNDQTRFQARRMRVPGDVAGADNVLTWQTGYPFAVNFARGYPRYNPDEYTAQALLERGEVDACLLVGSEGIAELSCSAAAHLKRIPTVALESPGAREYCQASVRITTAVYGIHRSGTAYRMDDVPIPLGAILPAQYPSDAEVLNDVMRRLPPPTGNRDWA
jgi:formylmethanofuran dehydrogenase subunit B